MKIESAEQLDALYAPPGERAVSKELRELEEHSRAFIRHSPFVVLSTADAGGRCDASPRGGEPGFVHVRDDRCLVLPDARGNRRLDSLRNIVQTGRAGLLFLVPGVDETLRVNGRAEVWSGEEIAAPFRTLRHAPATCIVVHVEEVFLHCAKALMRSRLWSREFGPRPVPFMGQMLADQIGSDRPPESQEAMIERYTEDL